MRIKNKFKMFFATATLLIAGGMHSFAEEILPEEGGPSASTESTANPTVRHMELEAALNYCNKAIELESWFNHLRDEQQAVVRSLYTQLERGNILTLEHTYWLTHALYRIHGEEDIHQYSFSPEFISMLGCMEAPEACRFFCEIWTFVPKGKLGASSKWFKVVSDFFCQLPDDQKNLANLHTLMGLHGITIDEIEHSDSEGIDIDYQKYPYYHLTSYAVSESDGKTKIRLRGIREGLKRGLSENRALDMIWLNALYASPAPLWDSIKGMAEVWGRQAREAALITVHLPLLPFALLNTNWGC